MSNWATEAFGRWQTLELQCADRTVIPQSQEKGDLYVLEPGQHFTFNVRTGPKEVGDMI